MELDNKSEKLYTVSQAAKKANIDPDTLARLCRKGEVMNVEIFKPGPYRTFKFNKRCIDSIKKWKEYKNLCDKCERYEEE